ncbi:MAG: hypothetical protein AAB780_00845 [Patescibacteria group bacterium]
MFAVTGLFRDSVNLEPFVTKVRLVISLLMWAAVAFCVLFSTTLFVAQAYGLFSVKPQLPDTQAIAVGFSLMLLSTVLVWVAILIQPKSVWKKFL